MTVYFAQNSTVSINSANQWNTAANGSGTFLTWPPASGDVLMANGKTAITINVNTDLGGVGQVRTDTANGATTGGGFILADGITLTANSHAGSTLCVTFAGVTGFIVGSINGGTGTSAHGCKNTSTGTLTTIGTSTGGNGSSPAGISNAGIGTIVHTGAVTGGIGGSGCYGVVNESTGVLSITGQVTGGGSRAVGYTGTITVNGNVTGSSTSATGQGVYMSTGHPVTITGSITATNVCVGFQNDGAVESQLLGPFICTALNYPAVIGRWRFKASMSSTYLQVFDNDGVKRTLYTTNYNVGGLPSTSNVRYLTTFGPANELTGSLRVPPAAAVGVGVLTDDTVGTASITASDIRTAIGLASANLDTQLDAIPTAAEIWGYTTRELTSASGITAQDVWEYATRTLTAGSGITAQDVWEYATRSLTEAPDVPTVEEIAAEVRTELTPELDRVANCATVESTGDQLAGLL